MFSDILNIVKITFEKGAEYTKEIVARMGRAGTVGERSLGYPDAGAHALGVIFTEIAGSLK
ncbi:MULTISPECIES: DAK2 domain-containing protein [Bacillus]|uniref:DAK2 domain-containing protein n=2 Tax=Bacillus cereus group TaxID=86661 RepID=A0A2B0Y105_BACAN|nr:MULTISPECIES: DAK2 domain-containing protein [Bacillus]KZD38770.1 Dihydroxyacetone kinase ATP-dependent [Bacillus cereus]MBJ8059140.1 DAK2 domain-containing protein [Bacillus cereus]MCU5340088.1 DAK2 domain-containing protein [Bacillus cereus]MDF2018055.1 DAK2 domain-containing protein [Bacillus sp. Cr_R3]MDF2030770.1 DAK2 domain-containing protein [Bacillus sp. Cr_R16]